MSSRPLRIGLTGPIGCGKSTVAGWLADLGGRRIDLDLAAHSVTAPGAAALPPIRARFGDGVFDAGGALDRAALAAIVFRDPAALADLEAIVHPFVRERLVREVADAAAEGVPFVVIEAIKLVESGIAAACDVVWIVDCGPEMQRARLAGRGVAPEDAERRMAAQGADLAGRLSARLALEVPAVPVLRLVTNGPEAEVRRAVEEALGEALADRG
ncbi:MAG: dephospho-CoA kinase [Candidatus Limnocylindrales bacterium]